MSICLNENNPNIKLFLFIIKNSICINMDIVQHKYKYVLKIIIK